MSGCTPLTPPADPSSLDGLRRRYLWWEPVGGEPHRPERLVAQIMNLGTYDDIRRLEALLEPAALAEVMLHAQPGWFSPRSWDFWRGRLSRDAAARLPPSPPKRSFARAADA